MVWVCFGVFLRFLVLFFFQLASMILPDDENFLLLFRRETPLDNSVEFMRVCISALSLPIATNSFINMYTSTVCRT